MTMAPSPVYMLSLFCASAWMVFFSVHRLLMFGQYHMEEIKLWENDFFVATNICSNETLKANLGAQYQNICEEAEVNVNVRPVLRAIRKVIQNTYLCGDSSCIHLFEDLLSILSGTMAWAMLSVILTLILVILLFLCIGGRGGIKKRKQMTSYDIESTRVLMNDECDMAPAYDWREEAHSKQKKL